MDTPTCKWCGRTLRMQREQRHFYKGDPVDRDPATQLNPLGRAAALGRELGGSPTGGKRHVRIYGVRRNERNEPTHASISWDTGTYGARGDSFFCNLRCAYNWAVQYAPRRKRGVA